MNTIRRRDVATIVAPIVLGLIIIALWQAAVVAFDIQPYFIPSPTAIVEAIIANLLVISGAVLLTGTNALIGLLIGIAGALVFAALASRLRWFDEMTAPSFAILSVIPIVAFATVLYTMFGATSETPRWVVVAISVFIPVFTNALRGLRQYEPVQRDLMMAYGASARQIVFTVTIPNAVPFIFTGIKIASSIAVIAAIVAEYFGGTIGGLGGRITSAAATSSFTTAWALVTGAMALGLVFFAVASIIERLIARRMGH